MSTPEKKRSRRLRKKLHVGEFQELGFEFQAELKAPLEDEAEFALIDALIELVESRQLMFGGWVCSGFIAHSRRGSASEEDRQAVEAWLRARPELINVSVGPLVDAWYA